MRINVELSLFSDQRFHILVELVGNRHKAMGLLLDLWSCAAKYWSENQSLIPKEVFIARDFVLCAKAFLAEEREQGFYVKGSEKQFAWMERLRAGRVAGGKQSAKIRLLKFGTAQPNKNRTDVELPCSGDFEFSRTPSNALTLTPTLTLNTKDISQISPSQISTKSDTFDWFKNLWNEKCKKLIKCERITLKRQKSLRARLQENPDKEYWSKVFEKINMSKFLTGNNDRGWKANIEWILKPDSAVKVMEGIYDSKESKREINLL